MEEKLNELYRTDLIKYQEVLERMKILGVRVYRNSKGMHKVKYNINNFINNLTKEQEERNIEAFMKGFLGH